MTRQRWHLLLTCMLVLTTWCVAAASHAADNLIANADFSQGVDADGVPNHWLVFTSSPLATFELSEEVAGVGTHSLRFVDRDTERGVGLRSIPVETEPGTMYYAAVDVLVRSGQVTLYLDFTDAANRRVETKTVSARPGNNWQHVEVIAEAPPGTKYVSVILYSNIPNTGEAYFDNAVLRRVTEDAPVVVAPPATTGTTIGFRPHQGSRVGVNPPPFVWPPIPGAASYAVEYSQDPGFPPEGTHRKEGITLPLFTADHELATGTWYWRYVGVYSNGTPVTTDTVQSFTVPADVPLLPLPPTDEWMARIPAGHPRLFTRPETIQSTRDGLHVLAVESLFSRARTAAIIGADYPEEPPNPRAGGTLDIEAWRAAGASMTPPIETMHEIAFLYLITQKEVYAKEGKALLMHFAHMDPAGLTSYRNGAPEVAMRLLYFLPRAYTWLHDTLTEEEREVVRHSARIRGQEAYSMIKGRPFETDPFGSHQGRMLGFLGQLSIAFLDEIPEARDWLDYVVQLMFAVYPAWGGDEGGYAEGLSYWASYMNWVFDFFDAFKVAADIDLYQKPFFRNTGYFALYTMSPGARSPFSDSHNAAPGAGQRTVVTQLARMQGNGHFRWYIDQIGGANERSAVHQLLLDYPRVPIAQAPTDLPQARWFKDVGWVALHRDLADPRNNVQFTFKSSPYGSVSHSHADQNAFVLYGYGDGLAISTGYYPWSRSPHHAEWTNQTLSKNSILIDGRGQSTFDMTAKGHIAGLFTSSAYDVTAGEAATAYHNANLQRFTRHVIYVRPDLFVLVDDIRAQRPVAVDWLLHSAFELQWDEAGQTARTQGPNASLDVRLLAPEPMQAVITDRFVPPPEDPGYTNAWHLTASMPGKYDQAVITAVLVPRKNGEASPILIDAQTEQTGDWLAIHLTYETEGKPIHETLHMRLPSLGQAATLAPMYVTAADGQGNVVRALAITGPDDAELSAWSAITGAAANRIVNVPAGAAVAVMWEASAGTVAVETGNPSTGDVGLPAGDIVVAAAFQPNQVTVDGRVLRTDEWEFVAADGQLHITWGN